jgi:osmotically-inducible protein OsmY
LDDRHHDDAELQAKLTAALAADLRTTKLRVETEVVAAHVVLLGVVASDPERDAAVGVAEGVVSPDHVTNFLLLPDPAYEKRLRSVLQE